jgi:hypothetical protein
MRTLTHKVDFCVVGGGLAGMCAAIAAARKGIKVALMHDRPVPGGNCSSEIRMWVCGAHEENNLETGIIEEIQLENLYRNTYPSYSVWDSILYEKLHFEPNITLLMNCSCNDAVMDGNRIVSIKGWQLTSETWHVVEAANFADCSGDSILAPLSNAQFRYGREAMAEFNESIEPEIADDKTMGMSCLIQVRETGSPKEFIPPEWAHKYKTCAELPNRHHVVEGGQNFWWLEIGGEQDTVHDCEEIRDELLKITFGVWDHIKNHCDNKDKHANWIIDWVGFLPGKRESRRYIGDHVLTQNDVRAGGPFDDIVAYGGWSMDDHHPAGFRYPGKPTIFHPAPSPFGIPYRALYSKNIENLFFAGRNISASHAAMSSTRVMATCAILGQAVGTAAAIASEHGLSPRGVYQEKLESLQQQLMLDDCYLPGKRRSLTDLTASARLTASAGDPEALRNGVDRPVGEKLNAWECRCGDYIQFNFNELRNIETLRLVFDSNLNREIKNMPSYYKVEELKYTPPDTLVKDFKIEYQDDAGAWHTAVEYTGNHQRMVKVPLNIEATALRLTPLSTWGCENIKIFACDLM